MSRYIGPKNRLSRREGLDLFGKGNKLRRANIPPVNMDQRVPAGNRIMLPACGKSRKCAGCMV